MSVPPFVSHKFVSWFEDGLCHQNHQKQMIMFRGYKVLKKVEYSCVKGNHLWDFFKVFLFFFFSSLG